MKLSNSTGCRTDRVRVMGNGYDDAVFRPRRVDRAALMHEYDLEIPPEAPIVTFAGKLSKTKGVDILLEANEILRRRWWRPPTIPRGAWASRPAEPGDARDKWPEPPHFILFGTGNLEETLNPAKADTYSLEGVHRRGHCSYEEVSRFHNVAHHSIMPSRTEGFGLAALEAMGCGLPMIVSDIEGPTLLLGRRDRPAGRRAGPRRAPSDDAAVVHPTDHEALREARRLPRRGVFVELDRGTRIDLCGVPAGVRRSVGASP